MKKVDEKQTFKPMVELGLEGDTFRVKVNDKMNVFQVIGTLEYAKQIMLTGLEEEENQPPKEDLN